MDTAPSPLSHSAPLPSPHTVPSPPPTHRTLSPHTQNPHTPPHSTLTAPSPPTSQRTHHPPHSTLTTHHIAPSPPTTQHPHHPPHSTLTTHHTAHSPPLSPSGIGAFGQYLAEDFFLARYCHSSGFSMRISSYPAMQNHGVYSVKTVLLRSIRCVQHSP